MTDKPLLDTAAVAKIARLARIEVSDADKQHFSREISGILQWVEQLAEVNTDGVPQLTSVSAVKLPWRRDVVDDGNRQDAVVKNAPQSDYGCFVVPKVME
jgi:aspartyl-tRNA(Asn)/glutamyl-tRNA(Gln) amidotransferase subunit C